MLQLSLLLVFLPVLAFSQTLRTTGNLQIKARGCVKIYVKGEAKIDAATVLAGSADFQATGGTNKTFPAVCNPVIYEGCQIKVYAGSWVHILMSNWDTTGKVEVELFDLHGKGISKVFSETKTTPTWGHWVDISDLPSANYILQIKLNGKKYCSEKIGNFGVKSPCLKLFPNPVEDVLTIENLGEELKEGDQVSYEIWDMQGRPMPMPYKVQNMGEQRWAIRVSHLAAGTYGIRFGECGDRFVKQ